MDQKAIFATIAPILAVGGGKGRVYKEIKRRVFLVIGEEMLKPHMSAERWERFVHIVELQYKLAPFLIVEPSRVRTMDAGSTKFVLGLFTEWLGVIEDLQKDYGDAPEYFKARWTSEQLSDLYGMVRTQIEKLTQGGIGEGGGETNTNWLQLFHTILELATLVTAGYDLYSRFIDEVNHVFREVRAHPELFPTSKSATA